MPEGVVSRFESLRFRHASEYKSLSELAFSPDGKRIASVARDHTVRVWDLDGRELMRLVGNKDDCFASLAFSPDGEAAGAQAAENLGGKTSKKAAPASIDFEPLFRHIDNARKSGKLVKSSVVGGQGGGSFESTLAEPTLLVGFDYTLSTFYGGHLTVKALAAGIAANPETPEPVASAIPFTDCSKVNSPQRAG